MSKPRTYISLKPYSGKIFLRNRIFEINNGSNIFFNFKKRLAKYNIDINTIDLEEGESVARYLYCDIPYPWEVTLWKKVLQNRGKNILFCFESPLVNPFNQLPFFSMFFKRIYTWNDYLVDNKKYFKLYIPQQNAKRNTKIIPYKNKNFLVLINSNKMIPYPLKIFSPFKKNLYIEREKAIEFFDINIPSEFSLYGIGWNKRKNWSIKEFFGFKKYTAYKGPVNSERKIKILSQSKFALCFENCSAPGYITEKIFDCFKARCVPIYWGAPNITNYINRDCFIDFRKFLNYEKLLDFLYNIDEKTYNKYIENIEKLLASKIFLNLWFESGFEKIFLESIS